MNEEEKTERIEEINEKLERINNRLEELEDEDLFEEILNDLYGDVSICGFSHSQGTLLKEIDPIAFSCTMSDYYNEENCELENEKEELEEELRTIYNT